ncbi:MAG: cysteine desulfurase family protein [Aquiluna sp.]
MLSKALKYTWVMPVFLDHAATTPCREVALEALNRALQHLGNPSSVHGHGQDTRAILEDARDQVAKALGANRSEIIFTSGGTEANNQAVKGIYWARAENPKRKVIVTAATEHHALLDPIDWLVAHEGAEVVHVPVLPTGMVDLDALERILSQRHEEVAFISLMWVNNETGVITDIPRACSIAKAYDIPVHSDAIAAVGHVQIDFSASGLTAMSISGHKFGAPIGVGALVVSRDFSPVNLLHGGGQERGLRSGTMNYPLAAALGAACEEAVDEMQSRQSRLEELRDLIEAEISHQIPSAIITAGDSDRVQHNSHIIFPGAQSDNLLFLLDQEGVSVSAGSACQAGVLGPSHVLLGMGYSEELAGACLRVTLGHTTCEEDVESFIRAMVKIHPGALVASQSAQSAN